MSGDRCLDSLDLEALASGEAPLIAPDAAEHAAICAECGRRLEEFRSLGVWLSDPWPPERIAPAFAEGVERLRGYSRREKRSLRVWAAPIVAFCGLLASSALALALPVLSSTEQIRLWAALGSSFGREARSLILWPRLLLRTLPAGVSALGEVARGQRVFSAAAILLLLPVGFATRWVLGRRRISR